jgi:erythromycin esterase-like protein
MERKVNAVIYMVLLCSMLGCVPRKYNASSSPKAHIVPTIFWPEEPTINVCWENPNPQQQSGWETLKEALTEQYNGRTPVKFVGFEPCTGGAPGVHVFHEDGVPGESKARPAVVVGESAFGVAISGRPNAVRMNFTLQNWHPDLCSTEPNKTRCIRMYALHEFGHVLGLGEEHLRSDNTCSHPEAVPVQGFPLNIYATWGSQYDPYSIMNYCMNIEQITKPASLSDGDVEILNRLYGKRNPLPKGLTELSLGIADNGSASMGIRDPAVWSDVLSGADFVALGEPIHGSAINALAFVSLIRDAFEQHNFRVLNLELPWTEMAILDEKLQSGVALSNDEIRAKTGSLYSYFLQEVMKWMQQQNQKLPVDQRYHVAGFDTQQVVSDFQRLRAAWATLKVGSAESFDDLVKNCHGAIGFANQNEFNSSGADTKVISKQEGDACVAAISVLRSRFELAQAPARMPDWPLVDLALRSRVSEVVKWQEGVSVESNANRDASMAEAFSTISRVWFPGKKQILWGHRWHMMKNTKKLRLVSMSEAFSFMNKVDSMGTRLASLYGARYKVIGTVASSYTVRLKGLRTFTIEDPLETKPGTLSEFLFSQRRFFMLGDVATLANSALTQNYVRTPQSIVQGPNAGMAIDVKDVTRGGVSSFEMSAVREHFDGILYLFHAL